MAGNVGLDAVAESTGQFGNNFSKTVANDNPGNLIMSPLSAQMVLAMSAYGAGGKTATQMRSALFIPTDNDLGQSGYQSLIETLNAVKEVELRLANKMYIASQFEVKPEFKELTAQKFYSLCEEVDFSNSTKAAKTINTWCEEKTNNRIKNLVTKDSLEPGTKLVLLNAVYFKGAWEEQFDPAFTLDRPFHIDEHTTKCVPTMYINIDLRFGKLSELSARFIEIPYKGRELSIIIILPNDVNGLQIVQDNLHRVNLKQTLEKSRRDEVDVFLPKFKIESTIDLQGSLEKLGMTDMFTSEADFSGKSDHRLKIDKIIQKAFIEVNEHGTEAAAVTEEEDVPLCMPPRFRIDKPFYYAIYHQATGISVFTGVVQQPNWE